MIIDGRSVEAKAIHEVAELMAAAARTAPKGCGIDNLEVRLVDGEEKAALADKLKEMGEELGAEFFVRDGYNLDQAEAVVLFGAVTKPIDLGNMCGLCGYKNCGENRKNNGLCCFNTIDLGIALGSAASVAAVHKIDNRILFTAGKAAMALGYFPETVRVAFGIPLSVSSKSPFFDRAVANPCSR